MPFGLSARISVLSLFLVAASAQAQTPPSFAFSTYKTGFQQPVGVVFDAEGHAYVWEKGGVVKLIEPNGGNVSVLIDLSDEVLSPSGDDHGLLGFALDPDFATNGYVYLWYTVERALLYNDPGLPHDIGGATQGRCTRYTVVNHQVDLSTRHNVLGQDLMDGPPIVGSTHGVGTALFAADGSLVLSVGDGSLGDPYGPEGIAHGLITQEMSNYKQLRAQRDDTLSGKLLRVDKATGDGLPGNPYYDPNNKRSPQSRWYAKGLRNPFRVTNIPGIGLGSGPGYFLVSDTQENTWEELSLYTSAGDNGGWPYYEGFDRARINEMVAFPLPVPEPVTVQPLFSWPHQANAEKGLGTVAKIRVNNQPVLITSLNNSPNAQGTSSTGNTFYPKNINTNRYNHLLDDVVVFSDYTQDKVRAITYNTLNNAVDFNNPNKMVELVSKGAVVDLYTNPYDGYIYAVAYGATGAEIDRLALVANIPPTAVIQTADATASSSNSLTVQFYGDQSFDPDDSVLTYTWNFGDGSPVTTAIDPIHTFTTTATDPANFQVTLTVADAHSNQTVATKTISLNNLPPQVTSLSVKDNTTGADITSIPVGGNAPGTYSVTLDATAADDHTAPSNLVYTWEVDRHHNGHIHSGQPQTGKTLVTQLVPEGGCGEGATYWFNIILTVTDQNGATSTVEKAIYQDCVGLTPQTITVAPVSNKSLSEGSFRVMASSSSGLPVFFQKVSGPFDIDGQTGQVTFTGTPGEAVLYVLQVGNASIGTAHPVEVRFNIVNPSTIIPQDGHSCGAGPVTLAATTLNNASIAWYATPTGGAPLATGTTYSPTISQNTTFYAQATGGFGNVATARTPVIAYTTGRGLPFVEGFQGDGLPSGWSIKNSNNSARTWVPFNAGNGAEAVQKSFSYQNYFSSTDFVNGQVVEQDELRTPALDFSNTPFPKLTFDVAYAYNNADDGLSLWVSTDCGQTFTAAGFNKKGQALSTVGTQSYSFTPNSAGQWSTQTVDLSDYAGNPNVILAFRNTPAYGNNLYVDNVRVENAPYAPTASFLNPTSICPNQPTLFANISTGGATNAYLWTFLDHNGLTLGTSTQKSPSWTFTTPEWVSARLTVTNSQGTSTFNGLWILINPSAAVTGTTPGSRTGTGTVTLAAQASNNGTLAWYAAPSGGTVLGTGTSFTTPALSATTIYYVEASNGACPSSRVAVQATILGGSADITPPTTPTGLTATGTSQTATTLAWAASTDDVGVTGYDLYQGGNLVASVSGAALTYSVSGLSSGATYSFFVKAKDATGNVSAGSNTVTVTTLSNAATAPNASFTVSAPIYLGQPVSFTNTSTGGSTTTYQWSFFDHNNNPLGTSLATHPTWTFTNEEWVEARLIATNAQGTSTSYGPNWLYANPLPTVISTTPGSRTGTGTVTLGAQSSYSSTLSWYATLTGGTALGTGTAFTTPAISNTTTYYVEASKAGYTSPRVPVVASIVGDTTNVVAPVASFTVSAPICLGQTVTFTNTSTGGPSTTYQWTFLDHNNQPLGTSLATNPTWTFMNEEWVSARLIATNALGTSTSYGPNWLYANPLPTVTSTTPGSRTGTGTVALNAQCSYNGTLSWYATLTGGTALGTGTTFTTPAISTTTTYYVEASKAGCTSARVPVVATVN